MIRPRSCMPALLAAVLLAGCNGDSTAETTPTPTATSTPPTASPTAMPTATAPATEAETATAPATEAETEAETEASATPRATEGDTASTDLSGDDATAATAIAQGLDAAEAGYTAEEAQCIGDSWVTDVGVDALQQGGVLDQELGYVPGGNGSLANEDAEALADGLDGCADLDALLGDLRAQLLSDPSLSDAAVECLTPIVDSLDRDFLVAGYTGNLEAYDKLGAEADACEELG